MPANPLPLLVQYMQALAIPAVAVVGAWIAWQQMRIAGAKLRHDLYERRFAVFDAARTLLQDIERNGTPSQDALRSYAVGTADAVFLFDNDICKYLEEIRDRTFKLKGDEARADRMPDGHPRARLVDKASDENEWLLSQLAILSERFKPILSLYGYQRWWRH